MSTSSKPIIAIIGSTGAQGGSVIDALLNDNTFAVRAITRDKSKPNALKLESRGAEVVEADLGNGESLRAAFEGVYGVFGVTNFWATMNAEIEVGQGRNVADAAKAAGVKHLVFSTLINVTEVSKGTLTGVKHFDSKAKIAEYIRSIGIPASFFQPGFYMSNIPSQLQKTDNGSLTWMLPIGPNSHVPLLDTQADSGKYVLAILKKGLAGDKSVFGKDFPAATRYMSPKEIVDTIGEVKSVQTHFVQVPYEGWKKALLDKGMPEPAAEDFGQNMMLLEEGGVGYFGGKEVEAVWKGLGIRPTEFRDWVEREMK